MSPKTRKEAKEQQVLYYYPAVPCARCGGTKYAVNGGCDGCIKQRQVFQRERRKVSGKTSEYCKTEIAKRTSKRGEVKRKYGITLEQYEAIIASNTHCPICKNEFEGTGNLGTAPCLDHCHDTGKVRGAICGNCNRMLGYSKDNIDTLKNAISYLEANPK